MKFALAEENSLRDLCRKPDVSWKELLTQPDCAKLAAALGTAGVLSLPLIIKWFGVVQASVVAGGLAAILTSSDPLKDELEAFLAKLSGTPSNAEKGTIHGLATKAVISVCCKRYVPYE